MAFLNKIYQYISMLSLDVVAGAVIGSLFFAKIFNVAISMYTVGALALSVWVIYTLDHLRDARIISQVAATDRHRFHQNNFRILSFILPVAILIGIALVWFIPGKVTSIGMVLAMMVIVYLFFQRHIKFLKELLVAALYTGGVLLPSFALTDVPLMRIHYVVIVQFFITALINLLLFSLFDYEQDRQHDQQSFVTRFGPESSRRGILILVVMNLLGCFWVWPFDLLVAVILMMMNCVLLIILLFQKNFISNNLYRILGDGIFLLPVFYLL